MSDWNETHRETLRTWLSLGDSTPALPSFDAAIVAALAEIARLRAERDALPDTIMAALDLELKIGLTHGDWPSLRARVRQAIVNVLETP